MLTARSVITATIVVAVISIVGACVTLLLKSPGSSQLGSDSYGTRANGFRAIHDVLDALGVTVERQLVPTANDSIADASLVLWRPLDSLVQTEPAHLNVIADWVRAGAASSARSRLTTSVCS